MRKIKFYGSTMYCGTDYEDIVDFEDNVTDEELDDFSEDLCIQHAESYSYLYTGWENDFEDEEDREYYFADCLTYCGWEEISEE